MNPLPMGTMYTLYPIDPNICKGNWMMSGRNLKKVGLVINSLKTEEICVNTTVNHNLILNSRDIKRSSDFYHLGSVLYEDGGARKDVSVRIQKARGSFSVLRKVWLSTLK
jgi:hypothetical protein